MIDQGTIERVMEAAQNGIVEVVSDFVSLRKRGTNYVGCCPFHNEKTPSFAVSPHKGIFKCFGCGKVGGAVRFVMEHEQMSYPEAIRYLGKKFHIPVEEVEMSPERAQLQNERESMMAVSSFAQRFFERSLFETDEGQSVGLSYLRSRGYRDDIIRKFQLGYSPQEPDAFTKEALKNSFKKEFLEKTGLSVFANDMQADRFCGRVIFSIHNQAGKVIAFSGRTLNADNVTERYLASPESEIYQPARVLYGFFQAKQEMVRQERCYLVEGCTDVIALHQAGIANVVAAIGSAITADQIATVSRLTPNVTIMFNGNKARIMAALRELDLLLQEGMKVKVVTLPEGDDPDSFCRKTSADELRAYIARHETDFILFKSRLLLDAATDDPANRDAYMREILNTLAAIPDLIMRKVYVKECSNMLEVSEGVIEHELEKMVRQNREKFD